MYILEMYIYYIDKQKQTKRYQTNLKTRQISFVTSMMNEGIWEGIQKKSMEAVQGLVQDHKRWSTW